ncbi:uncharacterized protein TNCV_613651 [Trichonephila clavipes]|nr:uncharacterized protein TNCV_613651 [Trichonephila clavipes]
MRVWKQWTEDHRKTGRGQRKVTSARDDRYLLRMAVNERTTSSRQLAARWSTATGVMSASSTSAAPRIACKGCFYTGSLSRLTIDSCVCNGLMSPELGKLIGTELSFQMNHASICGTMMAAFVLDTMPVNAAFQRTLSNNTVA